jgi:hypothetical protein
MAKLHTVITTVDAGMLQYEQEILVQGHAAGIKINNASFQHLL